MQLLTERRVGKHRLHQVLTVVERALDRDVADIRRGDGGHLPTLHVADPAVRMQERDVDAVASGTRLDGCRTSVTRGGTDDRHPCIAGRQDVIEQTPDQLQRHVLEGQRRTVKQLLHEQACVQLDQRHDGGMAEAGIRVAAQRCQSGG